MRQRRPLNLVVILRTKLQSHSLFLREINEVALLRTHGHKVVAKLLLETKSSYGRTPLSWAALYEHEAVVKLLLKELG
jgi:ankyrin repeat protein